MKKVSLHFIKIFSLVVLVEAFIIVGNVEKAFAATGVSERLSYQGRLTDNNGSPLTNTYCVRYSIYDTQSAGTKLWPAGTPTATTTAVSNGVFSAPVGEMDSLASYDFSANSPEYLNVEVNTTPITCGGTWENLVPRQSLDATPYARVAYSVFGGNVQVGTGAGVASGQKLLKLDWKNTGDTLGGACSGSGATQGTLWFDSANLVTRVCNKNIVKSLIGLSNDFFDVTGPTVARTFTFPDVAGATVLTSANAVTAAQGGTGQSTYTIGDLLYASASNALSKLIDVTAGSYLRSGGAGAAPVWSTVTLPNTATTGDLLYASATNVLSNLTKGTANQVLSMDGTGTNVTWATPTGGGTPAGANTQIQYNNAGAFGASSSFTFDPTTNDLTLGGVDANFTMKGITNEPAPPAAGNLTLYTKSIAGRMLPKWVAPSGVDTSFQSNLGFNRIATVAPAGGATLTTAVTAYATAFTNLGTVANPTPVGTNALTSTRRTTFSSGAVAGTVAAHRQQTLMVWRGNNVANAPGGFFFTIRFGTSVLAAGNRAFIGLADSIAAPTNVNPTTSTAPGKVGMAINANTGNWNIVWNVTGTAPTVTALGASFPVNATDLYELVLYSKPNDTVINYRVTDISTGAQVTGATATTNIPAATTFLAPLFWITNNATAAAAIIDFSGWYLESDQ